MVRFTVAIDSAGVVGSARNRWRSCLSSSRDWRRVWSSVNLCMVKQS